MGRKRVCLLPFIFFAIAVPEIYPQAEPAVFALSIDDAVNRALEQSLNLKKNAIDLAEAEYSAGRLWAEIFPSFSVSAGLNFLPATPLFTEPGFNYKGENLSYSLNAGVSFSINPSFRASMKRIELAFRSQLLSYESASRQLEVQVIKNYLNLVYRKADISFMEDDLESAISRMEADRAAWANGRLSELNWLNSLLSVETARFNLSNARGSYQIALGEFLALLGMEETGDVIFSQTLGIEQAFLDAEQLIFDRLPKRPDILSQRQTVERLEFTKDIGLNNARYPTLTLSTDWRGGSQFGGQSQGFSDSISGSLTLRFPIDAWIPGTRQNQSLRSADAEIEKARLDLQNVETSAKTQIRSLVSNLSSTWESVEIARLRVQIGMRTVEAAEEGFRNGTVSSTELQDRRNDLNDYRQRLFQGELSYKSLLLDLSAALDVDWRTLASLENNENIISRSSL